jgi:hypothetical protein
VRRLGRLSEVGEALVYDGRVLARQAALALEMARLAPGELLDQLGDLGVAARALRWKLGAGRSLCATKAPGSSRARRCRFGRAG